MANPVSLDELIRWRSQDIKSVDALVVAASLSIENFPDDKVALAQVEALRKFRKLSQTRRLSAVKVVLQSVPPAPTPTGVRIPPRDELLDRLSVLPFSQDILGKIVNAVDRMIDEKLQQAFQPSVPVVGSVAGSREKRTMLFRGSPFYWTSRSPLVEECWVGPVVIGYVEAIRIEDDGSANLYSAHFGTQGSNLERIPGQHAFPVAKKRVEARYCEWAKNALGVSATV